MRARARVSAHLGAVLVDAVVVGRNRAGANVGALADRGVADVREVRHFGPAAEGGVLQLDEGAHFALVADDGTRAQVGERADGCSRTDHRERAVCAAHARVLTHLAVDERRVGADHGAARDRGGALQLRAGQHLDIFVERYGAVDPHARGVADRDAGQLPAAHDHRVEPGACVAQLHAIVDARDEPALAHGQRPDDGAAAAHDADDVSEVLLVLRIVGVDERERLAQGRDVERIRARVDLGDRALGLSRITVLDDAIKVARGITHDAAVARGVIQYRAQHRRCGTARPVRREQLGKRRGVEQGHVTRDDEHVAREVGG